MKVYKAQLKNKAAFLNRLNGMGIKLPTSQIKDYPEEGIFKATITDPDHIKKTSSLFEGKKKKFFTKNIVKNFITRKLR